MPVLIQHPLPNIPCWSSVPPLVRTEVKMELYTLFPGERLVLQCLAQDETPIVGLGVIWTRDHAALLNGDHMWVNEGQLEIGSVKPTDSGLYSCTVQSFLGNHSAYFIVNVTGTSYKSSERMSFFLYRRNKFLCKWHLLLGGGYGWWCIFFF